MPLSKNKHLKSSTESQVNLWIIENVPGGELEVFKYFSSIFDSKIYFFWNHSLMTPADKPARNFCFKKLIGFLDRFDSDFFKKIYKVIFKYFLIRFLNLNLDTSLVSSSYIPIPKGRNIFAYIHTTPRFLNIDKGEFMAENNLKSKSKKLVFSVFATLFKINYVASLHNAKLILCNSKVVKERLDQFFNVNAEVLYFPFNSEIYQQKKYDKFFLCCSRVNRIKRQDFVLRAFELFYENYGDFSLTFVSPIPSRKSELEYLEKLKTYAVEKSLPVSFLIGLSRENVIDQFSNCYATLFAAKNEDFGLVLLESLASGKPVISVNEGGPIEILEQGVTGFLVNSEVEMAQKMTYLANNREFTVNMGERGKKYVKENFGETAFLKRMKDIFKKYQ